MTVPAGGYPFEGHQCDLEVPAGAQKLKYIHQLAIRHGAVGTKEDAAVLSQINHSVERADEVDTFNGGLVDCNRKIGRDGHVDRLVRLLRGHRCRGRQVDRKIDRRQRRRNHEDDE
jgi:hypothetical protein